MNPFSQCETVADAQRTIQAIAVSLHSYFREEDYVYGTLVGCCTLLDSERASMEVETFATGKVQGMVDLCFERLLEGSSKTDLLPLLKRVVASPKTGDVKDAELIAELGKLILSGKVHQEADVVKLTIPYDSLLAAGNTIAERLFGLHGTERKENFQFAFPVTAKSDVAAGVSPRWSNPRTFCVQPLSVQVGEQQLDAKLPEVTIQVQVIGLDRCYGMRAKQQLGVTIPPRSISPIPGISRVDDLPKSQWVARCLEIIAASSKSRPI